MVYALLLGILNLVLAIWVIVDVLTVQKRMSTGTKVLWIILAILFGAITGIVYYFIKKR